jgi:Arc/MetJ family transcription regulator
MAKTTVITDDELLDEATKESGAETKEEAITTGLEELICNKSLQALRQMQY